MKKFVSICFLFVCFFAVNMQAQQVTGDWFGTLKTPKVNLRVVFHISRDSAGLRVVMDSPDQGAYGIPANEVSYEKEVLTITWRRLQAFYKGKLNARGELVGTFVQGVATFPLVMGREHFNLMRPQEPRAPFPYRIEEVRFPNRKDSLTLAGTLTLPEEGRKYPVVVLISGSGAQNRNEEVFGHRPFAVLADHLTRAGIGVLRVDDRGVGSSTGDYATADLWDFANDTEAAVAYLQERGFRKIGLMGHSQGGAVAPIVADRMKKIAFVVLLAAPGVRGDEVIASQVEAIARKSGIDSVLIRRINHFERELLGRLAASPHPERERGWVKSCLTSFYRENRELVPSGVSEQQYINAQMKRCYMPEGLAFLRYDPAPFLRTLRCPVLALNGGKDLQVVAEDNLAAIERALIKGRSKRVRVEMLPGLNHFFQECESGLPGESRSIEQTFSPAALNMISDWIREVMNMR